MFVNNAFSLASHATTQATYITAETFGAPLK